MARIRTRRVRCGGKQPVRRRAEPSVASIEFIALVALLVAEHAPGSINFSGEKTTIKITLIHNPSAGDESQPSGDRIVELIQAAGHKVKYQSSKDKDWKKALKKPCDMVAVAGGDGTVGKVVRRLVGSPSPIAILPIGTANNIAHAMGFTGRALEPLIMEWESARRLNFDIGEAEGPWGSSYFIEGFGVGLFAATILNIDGTNTPISREDEITRVLRILKEQLQKNRAKKLEVRLDDQDLSGDYVLLQALNIRYVGPNLDLAPNADTNDGLLDVVLLPRGEERKLSRYLTSCITGKNVKAKLAVHRGRQLKIEWDGSPIHIDDKPWRMDNKGKRARSNSIDVKIAPHSVVFLCPQKTRRRPRRQTSAGRSA
ncbi:MAG: diacylglycerol/lipid kinase family protein [Candidatus Binatia bacterium]